MTVCFNQLSSISNQDRGEKNDLYDLRICYLMCLNNEFVADLTGLVAARLPRSHSLHYAHAWSAVAVLSVDAIYVNNTLQGSAATPFRCDGIYNYLFIANFLLSVSVKEF